MTIEPRPAVRRFPPFTPGHLLLLVAASALALGLALVWFHPLGVDGGWYSYPAYALAQGRDPSENLLAIEDVSAGPASVRARFPYELRSNLLVLIHAGWFTLTGTSLVAIKLLGLLQWLLLATLGGLATWVLTRHSVAASVVAVATLSDSWVISQSTTDLRPDVPVAILLVATVAALTRYLASGGLGWLAAALAGAAALPLVHITAAIATAFLGAFTAIAVAGRLRGTQARRGALLVLLCLAGMTLLRQPIIDLLVPTALPAEAEAPFRNDLGDQWRRLASMGIAGKLAFEFDRVRDYFLWANLPHLVLISAGVFGLWRAGRLQSPERLPAAALMLGAMAAATVILVADTTLPRGHIIPVAVMLYVCSGVAIAWGCLASTGTAGRRIVLVVGLATCVLRVAQAGDVAYRSWDSGLSNAGLAAFLHQVLEPGIDHTVVGPSYLWPYVQDVGWVTLIHPGSHPWTADDPRWSRVHRLVIDTELRQRGWGTVIDEMVRCRALEWDGAIGNDRRLRIDAFRVTGASCSRSVS